VIARAAEGSLPDDPAALRHALNLSGASAPLPALLKVVERVREREGAEPPAVRDQWRLTRAVAHVALANRDSRIALYDLREMLEARPLRAAGRLLEAAGAIGDRSLVPTLARLAADEPGLSEPCAAAFARIVRRESLRRTGAARGVKPEHREALARLWAASRSRRRSG
jgi:hypothetical protein